MNEHDSLENKKILTAYKSAISRYIRSCMVLQDVKYDDLVIALADKGIVLTASNLRNKVSKGLFSADMFVVLLEILHMTDNPMEAILKLTHDQSSY